MNPDSKPDLVKADDPALPATPPTDAPESATDEEGSVTDAPPTELSQLPAQETLNQIEDWSFGYVFSVVVCSLAPPAIVQIASLGVIAFGLRTMWLLRTISFREAIPAVANCRMQLLFLPVAGMMYRGSNNMWVGGLMAMIVFLTMQELLNISSLVNRVKKKIEQRERAGRGANDLLPAPAPDKKVGGKNQKGKKKKA